MLMRWIIELQSYDFIVQYRKGINHGGADGISRILTEDNEFNNNVRSISSITLRNGKSYGIKDVNLEKSDTNTAVETKELSFMDRLKKNQFEETWMKPLILFLRDKAIPTDSK